MMSLVVIFTSILWSGSFAFAEDISTAYIIYKGDYTSSNQFEVSNMPKIKSQGPFDVCTAFASQYIAQRYVCKTLNIVPCTSVPENLEISPFALSGFARTTNEGNLPGLLSNHKNLDLFPTTPIHPWNIINNAAVGFNLIPESCFPSNILNSIVGNNRDLAEDTVAWLKSLYEENNTKTECRDCTEKINRLLRTNRSDAQVMDALKFKQFPEFLHAIIFTNDCTTRVNLKKKPQGEYYPPKKTEISREQLVAKLEEVIKSDIPVQMTNVCNGGFKNGECKGAHAIVVAGIKTICRTDSPSDCKKLYKVHNTLGQGWQDAANDGWIDAENFINNVGRPYDPGTISWYK